MNRAHPSQTMCVMVGPGITRRFTISATDALVFVNSFTYDRNTDELVLRFKLELPKQPRKRK